jgi:hypothetical protein
VGPAHCCGVDADVQLSVVIHAAGLCLPTILGADDRASDAGSVYACAQCLWGWRIRRLQPKKQASIDKPVFLLLLLAYVGLSSVGHDMHVQLQQQLGLPVLGVGLARCV